MRRVLCSMLCAGVLSFYGGSAVCQEGAAPAAEEQQAVKAKKISSLKRQAIISVLSERNAIIVQDADGTEQEIVLTGKTVIKKGKTKLLLSDLSNGEQVTVYFKKGKDGQREPSTIKVLKTKKK